MDFWHSGNDDYNGETTTYCKWWLRKKSDTLFKKYTIPPSIAKEVFSLTGNLRIDTLKDDKVLYPGVFYFDGYPFQMKILRNDTLTNKQYEFYEPHDTAPELKTIKKYLDSVSVLVNLKTAIFDFETHLPLKGCTSNFTALVGCRPNGAKKLGYRFSSLAPYGIYFSKYFYTTKKRYIDTEITTFYNTDFHSNADFELDIISASPFNIKVDSSSKLNIDYKYRYRNYSVFKKNFRNFTINTWYKIPLGIDMKTSDKTRVGLLTGYTHKMKKLNTLLLFKTMIYLNEFDFTITLYKFFNLKKPSGPFDLYINYENFQNKHFFNASLNIYF